MCVDAIERNDVCMLFVILGSVKCRILAQTRARLEDGTWREQIYKVTEAPYCLHGYSAKDETKRLRHNRIMSALEAIFSKYEKVATTLIKNENTSPVRD